MALPVPVGKAKNRIVFMATSVVRSRAAPHLTHLDTCDCIQTPGSRQYVNNVQLSGHGLLMMK